MFFFFFELHLHATCLHPQPLSKGGLVKLREKNLVSPQKPFKLLSVETSERRELLAARKMLLLKEEALQSCPFLHSGTNGQN